MKTNLSVRYVSSREFVPPKKRQREPFTSRRRDSTTVFHGLPHSPRVTQKGPYLYLPPLFQEPRYRRRPRRNQRRWLTDLSTSSSIGTRGLTPKNRSCAPWRGVLRYQSRLMVVRVSGSVSGCGRWWPLVPRNVGCEVVQVRLEWLDRARTVVTTW